MAIDDTNVILEWDALPATQTNGILTAYIVDVTERETGIVFSRNATGTSIILTELNPEYLYECRVAGFTMEVGPFSAIFAVQILVGGEGFGSMVLYRIMSVLDIN